jgi:SAM-dependent methyltransferase
MNCPICNHNQFKVLFSKKGVDQNLYDIVQCRKCKVVQTYPQPIEIEQFYQRNYFHKRTDRGYNNYLSDALKKQLISVWELNLKDLGFFSYEEKILNDHPKLLEIGCAAGYFLEYMKLRGWDVLGVEISKEMSDFAKNQLGLNVVNQDFLEFDITINEFDCVVLWASIEHFKDPIRVFKKIDLVLKPKGVFVFSTCRWGLIARLLKDRWRFMNVPEHLFFFNETQLEQILASIGFKKISRITYGSGFTSKPEMSLIYRLSKRFFDTLVKRIHQGDMLAMMFQKV